MNSGVCSRKFLYASQEKSEKSPSSPWVYPPQLQQRILSPIRHSSSGFVTGSDFSITWCTSVKIAVVAPMPRASVMTAVAVNPGAFRSCRSASRSPPAFLSLRVVGSAIQDRRFSVREKLLYSSPEDWSIS